MLWSIKFCGAFSKMEHPLQTSTPNASLSVSHFSKCPMLFFFFFLWYLVGTNENKIKLCNWVMHCSLGITLHLKKLICGGVLIVIRFRFKKYLGWIWKECILLFTSGFFNNLGWIWKECVLLLFAVCFWFGFGKSFSFLKTVSSQGDQKLGHAIYAPNLGMSILNTPALIVID